MTDHQIQRHRRSALVSLSAVLVLALYLLYPPLFILPLIAASKAHILSKENARKAGLVVLSPADSLGDHLSFYNKHLQKVLTWDPNGIFTNFMGLEP